MLRIVPQGISLSMALSSWRVNPCLYSGACDDAAGVVGVGVGVGVCVYVCVCVCVCVALASCSCSSPGSSE